MNMKRILLAIAVTLPILSVSDINAQGVVVYQNDGTRIEVPYSKLDSIVTYETATPGQGGGTIDLVGTVADAVDLGLPSGTLWASWNVGATAPEAYGGYYAWGETAEKDNYDWDTYKWCNGSYDTMTKYCTDSSYGTVDNKTVLELQDDVAHMMWGDGWRMPTRDEFEELLNKCAWEWFVYNGVNGYKITGTNGNSIFMPAAGYRYYTSLDYAGSSGGYWSRTHDSSGGAYVLSFGSGYHRVSYSDRFNGRSVRPVKEK